MNKLASRIYDSIINPPSDKELANTRQQSNLKLPTIWLLGKTGAGKTTIVQKLTGHTKAEIGNGFKPCTKDSSYFEYPQEHPILRFLDTRGLGEIDYDANDDLDKLSHSSHALLVVARIRDVEQSATIDALQKIRQSAKHIKRKAIVIVHTGALELHDEHDRKRAVEAKQATFEKVWGSAIDHCVIDFSQTSDIATLNDFGVDALKEMIGKKVPELSLWINERDRESAKQRNYDLLRTEILWYAGTAAASDVIPLVGLVSVPAIQGKMLHSLAQRYDLEWTAKNFSEFIAALGTSFALRYTVSLGARQLGKLIPVYGQVVGAAFAATISYASTYAIGRAACSYLYHKKNNTPIDSKEMGELYKESLKEAKRAGQDAAK